MNMMSAWFLFQGVLFMGIAFFSMGFVNIWKKIARLFNLVDHPGARKIHAAPVPYLGGASIFFAVWGILVAGMIFMYYGSEMVDYLNRYPFRYLANIEIVRREIAGLFIGSLIIFLVGLVDDWRKLSPLQKILGQCIAALVVFFFDIRITFFLPSPWMHLLLTVFWVVLITNTFNLLDNMNGLSSGVAVIVSFFLWVIAVLTHQFLISILLVIFGASVLGFWFHNFRRGSIFLGDAGSLFLGFFLSIIVVLQTFAVRQEHPWLVFFLPFSIFALPLYDTLSVVFIRLKKGASPFQGDKNHFSHRLVNLGLSREGAVCFIYLVCIMTGFTSLAFLASQTLALHLLFILQLALLFVIISILEYLGRKNSNGNT